MTEREVFVPGRRALGDQPDDLVVHLRVQGREGQVLELPLDRVHTQPVGQRGVDLEGLAGDPLLLLLPQEAERAHVVQPVGELDHQHPDVLGHRDDHLADGLGLRGLAVLDLVELGDAVDEHGDLFAEVASQVRDRVRRVLDGVVQERGAQGRRRHTELGQDGGDRERVRDVRVTALAELAGVVLLRGPVGALDHAEVGLRVGRTDDPEQRLEHRRAVRVPGAAEAGEPGANAGGREPGRLGGRRRHGRRAHGVGARGGSCGTTFGTADVIAGSSPTLCPSADRPPV